MLLPKRIFSLFHVSSFKETIGLIQNRVLTGHLYNFCCFPFNVAKEDRLRKLESELQLKQDLLVAKGNEVSSLEATVAASTATNDALCAEKENLQTELRRYRLVTGDF